jgi:hypothetical protein
MTDARAERAVPASTGRSALARLTTTEMSRMPTYRMVYGDDEQVVRETFDDVVVEREDGWTVLFRGDDAILRVQDAHVQSLDRVDAAPDEPAR